MIKKMIKKNKSKAKKNTLSGSTYEDFIKAKSPKQKKEYDEGYKEFLLSEMILAAMEEDDISVRKLAALAGVSPTIVQEMKSGSKKSFNTKSFFTVLKSLGYNFMLEKNGTLIPLDVTQINKK